MTASTETETLDHQSRLLFAAFLYANAGAHEAHVHAIADCDLSLSKLKLLHVLARPHTRPPKISRVASLIGVDASQAARVVGELERDRYVDRIDGDERDKRVQRVVITPTGRGELRRLERAGLGDVREFVRTETKEERRLMGAWLTELAKRPEVQELAPDE